MNGERPEPFSAYSTPEFWDDPHISAQMLRAHLDPERDAASRQHAFIDRSVDWIISSLRLGPRSRVLDLGCGPGLYARRMAGRGISVRGIDVSRRSIRYAEATTAGLSAEFTVGNYLDDQLGDGYQAALLIYEDFSTLSPRQRSGLLGKIATALLPGGVLIMDVTSRARFATERERIVEEQDLMGGFWAPPPYVGIHETWTYPDLWLVLDRFTITTPGRRRQYWNWMACLTPDEVAAELAAAGFDPPDLFGDVAGAPYDPGSPTFAVVARSST